MKITDLKLTHFRSHQKTTLALDRITIIRGYHGAGKSSIQDALEYLLTGTTRQTDAGGRGADILIQHGKQEMGVQATFEASTEITRLRNRAGGSFMVRQSGKVDCVGKLAESWMQSEFFSLPILQACLNSGRFLSLVEKEQRNLLTSALASKPVEVPRAILAAMEKLVTPLAIQTGKSSVASPEEADKLHKIFYDARTNLNREIKALGELTAPDIPADMPTAAAVRKELNGLRTEREGHLTGKARKLSEHAANHERLKIAREQLQQFKADILEDTELERLRRISGNGTQVTKISGEIEGLNRKITSDRQALVKIQNAPSTCPTCNQPIEQTDSAEQIADLEKQIATDEQSRIALQAKLTKLGDPATALQKLDAHKKAVIATGSAERAVKELKDLPETCDVSDLETKITTCAERIARGEEVLAEVQRLEGAKQQYEQTAQRKEELAKAVIAAEQVIEAFGSSGPIRAQLVGDRLEPFKARLNEALAQFGFVCEFALDPFGFSITQLPNYQITNSSKPLSLKQLSESEAFRFSIAFQIALAEATGLNFVVIDRSDMLLSDLRSTMLGALLESKLEQAIVLVAGEPTEVPDGALPAEVKLIELAKDTDGITQVIAQYANQAKELGYEEMPQ